MATVDLAAWLAEHVTRRRTSSVAPQPLPPWVFAKMDIEGAEFRTLGRMLMSGVLCAETIGTMTIEFHPHVWKQSMRADEKNWFVDLFMHALPTVLHFNPRYCTPPKLIKKQDDSYTHDTFMPTVCGSSLPDEQPVAARKEYPRHFAKFSKADGRRRRS